MKIFVEIFTLYDGLKLDELQDYLQREEAEGYEEIQVGRQWERSDYEGDDVAYMAIIGKREENDYERTRRERQEEASRERERIRQEWRRQQGFL